MTACDHSLIPCTRRKPLILCVEKQLIGEHQNEILDKGMCSVHR